MFIPRGRSLVILHLCSTIGKEGDWCYIGAASTEEEATFDSLKGFFFGSVNELNTLYDCAYG